MLLEQQVRSFVISSSERCHSEICKVSALTLGQTGRGFFSALKICKVFGFGVQDSTV